MKSRTEIRRAAAVAALETLREVGNVLVVLVLLHFFSGHYGDSSWSNQPNAVVVVIVLWFSFSYWFAEKRNKPNQSSQQTCSPSSSAVASGVAYLSKDSKEVPSCHREAKTDQPQMKMKTGDDLLTRHMLPPDVFIHIGSYLLPQEVTALACVNRSTREIIDGEKTSSNNKNDMKGSASCSISDILWKELWYRDYGWLILDWDVGQVAFERSMNTSGNKSCSTIHNPDNDDSNFKLIQRLAKALEKTMESSSSSDITTTMKYFYFLFGEAYMNYMLAGQNTPKRALLGLHSHIFDFTKFQYHHPGLADPIRLECGKDATDFFEDIPHSKGARKIARKLCIIANRACCWDSTAFLRNDSSIKHNRIHESQKSNNKNKSRSNMEWGLFRPPNSNWSMENSNTRQPPTSPEEVILGLDQLLPMTVTKPRRPNTLYVVRDKFDAERQKAEMWAKVQSNGSYLVFAKKNRKMMGNIRVYFDPFLQQWRAWYTGLNFFPVYLDDPLDLTITHD